jgi:hypothetical protein
MPRWSPQEYSRCRERNANVEGPRPASAVPQIPRGTDTSFSDIESTLIVSYDVSDALREAEFIYGLNRLTVVVTRARSKCIVCLPEPLLHASPEVPEVEAAADGLASQVIMMTGGNVRLFVSLILSMIVFAGCSRRTALEHERQGDNRIRALEKELAQTGLTFTPSVSS